LPIGIDQNSILRSQSGQIATKRIGRSFVCAIGIHPFTLLLDRTPISSPAEHGAEVVCGAVDVVATLKRIRGKIDLAIGGRVRINASALQNLSFCP
jgi:hypothetical protein